MSGEKRNVSRGLHSGWKEDFAHARVQKSNSGL